MDDLFKLNCMNFMHNFAFGRQPRTFDTMFTPLGLQKGTGNYKLLRYKSAFFDKFPSVFLPKIWNANSAAVKQCTNSTSLKLQLTDSMVSKYNMVENCQYRECPDCRI